MHVAYEGRVANVADLRDGSVSWPTSTAAPSSGRSRPSTSTRPASTAEIVTVGPFLDGDERQPGAYEPHVVRRLAVVDLTGVPAFAFSTAPEHVAFGPPPSRERPGLVLLVGDDAYLGCRFHEGDGLWETAYLNVATGEIVFQLDAAEACVSRQWALRAAA